MIWAKLAFGGFGRRGLEAIVACAVLVVAAAIAAGALMVVEGAKDALARAERADRPAIVQVKSRFNRAVFETPRSGNLPPLTIPVYEPLVDPAKLEIPGVMVVPRQSLLRNVVSGEGFLNLYIFGIEPEKEAQISSFSVVRGRMLRAGESRAAVLDKASAQALNVELGGSFQVRKADGTDISLTVVGILDGFDLNYTPPRTIEAPASKPDASYVSSGALVTLRTSEEIFDRSVLTDALILAPTPDDVPSVVDRLREAFRLDPGVFISESYSRFSRKVRDFTLTLTLFSIIAAVTALVAGGFAASLLHDLYLERRRLYAVLIAIGFRPVTAVSLGIGFGLAVAGTGTALGSLVAGAFTPTDFAMPSLMADLGSIRPRFDLLAAVVVAGIAVAAVALGIARTVWLLNKYSVSANLAEDGR
jgi:ABC-type antimicrobial peptide transport system permease subunit